MILSFIIGLVELSVGEVLLAHQFSRVVPLGEAGNPVGLEAESLGFCNGGHRGQLGDAFGAVLLEGDGEPAGIAGERLLGELQCGPVALLVPSYLAFRPFLDDFHDFAGDGSSCRDRVGAEVSVEFDVLVHSCLLFGTSVGVPLPVATR